MSLAAVLVANAAAAGLLAVAAWLLGRARFAPRRMHQLWVLVLAKGIAPPLVALPVVAAGIAPRLAGAADGTGPASWPGLALAVWLLGALGSGALASARTLRLLRRARRAAAPAPELVAEVTARARVLGLRRPPRVAVVEEALSPCLVGLGPWTVLLFPRGLLERLDARARGLVVAHELAHVARRDPWVRLLELVAGALFWWNPLVALARRELRRWEELACDARVLTAFPGEARAYAGALVETVAFLARREPRLATALAGGDVGRRVRGILAPGRARPGRGLAAGLAVALFAALLPLGLAAAEARWVVHATDPAGAFELEFEGEAVTGVVLDGRRLAPESWELAPGRLRVRPAADEAFDVTLEGNRRIRWEARAPRARE